MSEAPDLVAAAYAQADYVDFEMVYTAAKDAEATPLAGEDAR